MITDEDGCCSTRISGSLTHYTFLKETGVRTPPSPGKGQPRSFGTRGPAADAVAASSSPTRGNQSRSGVGAWAWARSRTPTACSRRPGTCSAWTCSNTAGCSTAPPAARPIATRHAAGVSSQMCVLELARSAARLSSARTCPEEGPALRLARANRRGASSVWVRSCLVALLLSLPGQAERPGPWCGCARVAARCCSARRSCRR